MTMGSLEHSRRAARFAETRNVPLGIYEDLFHSAFDEVVFQQWCVRRCTWQLQVIGPPGSGKTTFAALAIRRLRNSFSDVHVKVASIFLQNGRHDDDDDDDDDNLVYQIFESLRRQLSSGPSEQCVPSRTIENTRELLRQQIQSLQRAFLVIDDVDLCRASLLNRLEHEFSMLQSHGLNVMVTSRVPLHHDPWTAKCDVDGTHLDVPVYWCCATCHGKGDTFDGENVLIICQHCRDAGSKCSLCDTDDMLYEPYPHVNLILKGLLSQDPTAFSAFVAQALELAHGDLDIGSRLKVKPPHSVLGKNLTKAQAERTVVEICDEAACNIAVAKLRLDIYQGAKVVEDLTRIGDRLPDNFLALFDAAIERVIKQPQADMTLGLYAIVAAVLDDSGNRCTGQPFPQLEARLQRIGLLEADPSPESHHSLDRILRATCGFLWIKAGDPISVEPYHQSFGRYVEDDYHDELYKVRMIMARASQSQD